MIAVNGTTLYVEQLGTGHPSLVMHGGLGLDHTYLRPLDELDDRLRLVYYDQRCNGRSERAPLETMTMTQLADDAAALCDALGFERTTVIGHSYGGFTALEYAIRHPRRVDRLIFVGTTAHRDVSDELGKAVGRHKPSPEVLAALVSNPQTDDAFRERLSAILTLYLNPDADVVAVGATLEDMIVDVATGSAGAALLVDWDVRAKLADITAPTLVVAGDWDFVCPAKFGAEIAHAIPEAQLESWDDCGHFPWVERPERFFATVRAWLDTHPI